MATAEIAAVERRDPRTLQPHPLNAQLYGDAVDAGLRADIVEHGIREPLRVTADGTIISGHSRWAIALELGFPAVPVIVSSLEAPTEIVAEMISSNNKRQKTNYVRAREYQHLKPIQAELARQRQRRAAEATHAQLGRRSAPEMLCANLHTASKNGRAGDAAAMMLGLKPRSAEYALKVVEAIDCAHARESALDAALLVKRLNQSILGGYKQACALGYLQEAPKSQMTPLPTSSARARWRWDPVTGCQGECAYCASADHAERAPAEFIDQLASDKEQQQQRRAPFAPRLHPGRLPAPLDTPVPKDKAPAHSRVLTCWHGDLFGPWVPEEWIAQVLDTVRASAEQDLPWRYLFLTKYPARLLEVAWPPNAWVGVTVDRQERVPAAEETLSELKRRDPALVTYLVCQPLCEELQFTSLASCSWLLVGGQEHTASSPACHPRWSWVLSLIAQAARDRCLPLLDPALKWAGLPAGWDEEAEAPTALEQELLAALAPLLPGAVMSAE